MKIKMRRQAFGSETGQVTHSYEAGQVYDLGHSPGAVALAKVFLAEGWAEEVLPPPPPPPPAEEKAAAPAENKAIPYAPRNKGRR